MKYKFIGWCKEGIHDKVWGVINLDSDYYGHVLTFWGRRGAKLQTKKAYNDYTLTKLIRSKEHKGYKEIQKFELDEVYPEFESDLEKTAMWATLML